MASRIFEKTLPVLCFISAAALMAVVFFVYLEWAAYTLQNWESATRP